MDLNTITFFPSFFFYSRTTIQHKKSTITNINFKQLKSTKCLKYIKCSISISLVIEKMLARLEPFTNVCTKLMKLLLCDVGCTYSLYNALFDSNGYYYFTTELMTKNQRVNETPNLIAVGCWMGEAIRKKHAQTYRSSQEIQHVIPVTVMFLSYIDIYRQNNRFINAFESIRDFHLICTSGAGQCLLSSSFSPVYPKQQGRCRAVAMSMLFLFCFDSDKSFQTDKYHFC